MMTLDTLIRTIRQRLAPVCHSGAQAQAETTLLLHHVLGISQTTVYTQGHLPVSPEQQAAVMALLDQRCQARAPIQYLLGQADFYGMTLAVSPHVLIPRPETELLVEFAIKLDLEQSLQSILDIGTGSGAIAIALAKALGSSARVVATDISETALAMARRNAETQGVAIDFRHGDLFLPVAGQCFNLIISNPPYIDETEKPTLAPEVLEHEPHLALFGPGGKRYAFYERFAQEAPAFLNPGGAVLLEVGHGMGETLVSLFEQAGFSEVAWRADYAGLQRILTAFMPKDT